MNRKIDIQFSDITNKSFKFEGLRELVEFLKAEVEFWKEQRAAVGDKGRQIHSALAFYTTFEGAITAIESWSKEIESWDESQLMQQIANLNQRFLSHAGSSWLWSGHPFVQPFIECHRKYDNAVAEAFLNYVTKSQTGNLNTYSTFLGVMFGYEFVNQDSDLVKRRNGEKRSLGQLRNQLEETTKTLTGEVEKFKDSFNSWEIDSREGWSDWLNQSEKEHDTQQAEHKDQFITFMDDCRTRISDLENTYQEKLRLEKPAQYWKNAARKFGIQGGLWSLALLASVLLGIVYFSDFFTDWLTGQHLSIQINTVQGIVIFGTVLAVYAFMVKTLSRLTFSSFHLMRDAEEREQLTYLYLSLVNDKKIDEGARDIVLQALFSRSETGLLVAESGPTMPGAGEVMKAFTKLK